MARQIEITTRQRQILTTIVDSYISTGEPVSSGAIARMFALGSASMSPATVRSEMAELADAGLLEQPHTSAGRVPSAQAFRVYVEGLHDNRAQLPSASQAEVQGHIDSSFAGLAGPQALLARTSHVLAVLSSGVGVAIGAATTDDLLEHVHFSRLATKTVLAVLVTRGGTVRDRVLSVGRDLSSLELETAARFLNEHYRGWNLERVRTELARRLEHERTEYQRLVEAAQSLWDGAVPQGERYEQTVYVEGVANLVGLPEDRTRLKDMLAALEAKQRLVELLNAYIGARQESVRVVFDLDEQVPEMAGLVLIAAPARVGGDSRGTVGVIGPQRMNYEKAMNAVSYVAQIFERMNRSSADDAFGPPTI